MYSKFRIKDNSFNAISFDVGDKLKGSSLATNFKKQVKKRLDLKFKDGEIIDGTATMEEWFPQIKCDIFLSHSHKDLKRAKEFSGWLKNKFGLDVFIDSNIWGNINDLLKSIDNEYCYNKKSKTYSYEKRNITTSHVHMMLINALAEMMDKTECLMFLETPNSIKLKKMLHEVETASPWIYSELALSKLIKTKKPERYSQKIIAKERMFSLSESKSREIEISYKTDISHLIELSGNDLSNWKNFHESITQFIDNPLDILYALKIKENGK